MHPIFGAPVVLLVLAVVAAPTTPDTARASLADEHIARDVRKVLRRTRGLQRTGIRVRVVDAVVHLWGSVRDVSGWALASRTARDVVGVHAVRNYLTIEHLKLAHK
jgi:hyperosmotically inducible protein